MARFEIEVSTSGEAKIKQLQSDISSLDRTAKSSQDSINGMVSSLKGMAIATVAAVGVSKLADSFKYFVSTTDKLSQINSQLKLVSGSINELTTAQESLFAISQKTRNEYESTANLYARLARSTESLGLSQQEVLRVTETISKAMTISGGSAESMNAAIIQLGQGLASGTLRGEELNSVMEQAPRLAKAIADGMGITIGQLRAYGSQNKITGEQVVSALKSQSNAIDKEFSGIANTVSGSMTVLSNSIIKTIGDIDSVLGTSTGISNWVTGLSSSLDTSRAKISNFAINTTAILQQLGSGFNLVFTSFIEGIKLMVYNINHSIYSVMEKLSEYLYKATQFLNSYGLSSKESLATSKSFYETMKKWNDDAKNGIVTSMMAVQDAYKNNNMTLADRIKLIKAEFDLQKKVLETQLKQNNTKDIVNGNKALPLTDAEIKDKLNQLKNYYEAIYDYENAWNKQQEIMRIDNKALTESQFTSLAEFAKREYFDKLNKMQSDANAHVEKYYKQLDSYRSIMGQFGTPDEVITSKYSKIIEDLDNTGMATNEDYKKINEAYLEDLHKELANQLSQMSRIGSIFGDVLTTVFNNVYDGIKESYQPLIKSNQYMARSLELQSNMYKTFGLSGSGAVSNYKSQIAQIEAQRQILAQDYKIMEQSKKYKEIVQPILEAGGLAFAAAGAVSLAPAQSILAGIEFALNAYKTADSMTGFTKYQQEYISAVETFKQQMRDLADTLVDIAGSVYDAIPSFRDLYDTISGTNTYQIQSQIEALKYVKQYTSLDKQSLTSFITDVLTAQSKFVNESINIAGSANENLIQSIDIFSKYGLAVDSLNEKFSDSLVVVADLIKANDEANNSILDFAKSIKGELSGLADKKTYRMESTRDFYSALRDYRSGNIEASQLLEYATTVKGTLSSSSEFKALIKELENVAKPQTTEDLLTKLTNQIANIQAVGLPVVNISSAQSVEAQTLTEIKDAKSLIQKMLDMLSNPVDGIVNFLEQILKAIAGVAVAIAEGVVKIVSSIAKAVVDLVRDLGKAFLDAVKGLATGVVGGAGDLVSNIASPVVNVFKKLFADGGYTGYNNGQIDSTGERVAGIVHEGEWVAPRWMVESNASLFNALESARLNGSNPSLGGVLVGVDNREVVQAINLNTQYSQQMNIRLTSLEAMFRTVTNGANAMMIEIT